MLTTYGWEQALVSTEPGDPVYPYPRLDFDAVGPPAPRSYRAVVLQNDYVQLVVLPELGGRILRWTDRTSGLQLCYANPVIKPTRWGYRGWWLATGGIEFAFPVEEHGLNEYRPWQYERVAGGVRVWDTDERSGLQVEVTIRLDAEHNYFSISPRVSNPTAAAQPYQMWLNAMLALSEANSPPPELTFIVPAGSVVVHSTGDGTLPAPGGTLDWPVHAGRDFSRYAEWRQYLGVFAPQAASGGYVGAYDPHADRGFVRAFPTYASGTKIFCLGDLDAGLYTDDGSRYFELWAGLTPSFWSAYTLEPGDSTGWTEHWWPVSGIGGYNWANADFAIHLTPAGDEAGLAVASSRARRAEIVLQRGGSEVRRWDVSIAPGAPFRDRAASSLGGDWGVQVWVDGQLAAQYGP